MKRSHQAVNHHFDEGLCGPIKIMQAAIIFLSILFAFPACATEIKGRALVIDGDTVWISGVKVRLKGIDASERGQPRFRNASRTLKRLVASQTVICHLNGERNQDRYIGTCFVERVDLAAAVIASGNALDCARYSGGQYRHLETPEARHLIRPAPYC